MTISGRELIDAFLCVPSSMFYLYLPYEAISDAASDTALPLLAFKGKFAYLLSLRTILLG